uniref:Pectate lyase n=1 Tax=Brassica oleracea TaxID=3712 RepID=A0A3P6DTG9_BRAOL|nr:unnamed protein product [Brassica oleracea]
MVITLKQELIMNSFKTNIIIHGIHIHDCKPTGNAMVRSSPSHYGWRTMADGDGISIFGSSHIWIDHNSLSSCADGLIDTYTTTLRTITRLCCWGIVILTQGTR